MLNERRSKLLIVEDQPSQRRLVVKNLSSPEYWMFEANRLRDDDSVWEDDDQNVESVQSLLERHFFHAVVIDLSLKENSATDKTGLEVLDAIENRRERTQSIILTGYGTTPIMRDAWKERGLDDWLDKDEHASAPAVLLERVEALVRQAKLDLESLALANLSYQKLVGDPDLSQVSDKLDSASKEAIRSIVEEALRPYFPYDLSRKRARFQQIDIAGVRHQLLVVQLWSRYLGSGVELWLGSRDACNFRALAMEDGGKKRDIDFVVYEYDPKDKLVALVKHDPDMSIQEESSDQLGSDA